MKEQEIARTTIKKASKRLKSAKILFEAGQYADSLSRAYYSMIDIIRGVLEIKKVIAKTHKGAITKFHQLFIKTGKIDKKYSKILSKAEEARENADYSFDVVIDKDAAQNALEQAEDFVREIKRYLRTSKKIK